MTHPAGPLRALCDGPLALLLAASMALHAWALVRSGGGLEADEAVVALMAKHIAEGRELPVFYYGQPYLGSLEALLVAGAFEAGRQSPSVARCVPFAASLLLVIAVYALALPAGRKAAFAAAACAALPAPDVLAWHLKIRGGFMLGALLVAALVLATARALEGDDRRRTLAALGLCAGLAAWTNQLALPLAAACLLCGALVARRAQRARAARGAALLLAAALGALPLVVYNIAHPARTFLHLAGHFFELDAEELDAETAIGLRNGLARKLGDSLPRNLATLATDTGPRLSGGRVTLDLPFGALPAGLIGLLLLAALARATPLVASRLRRRQLPERRELVALAVLLGLLLRRNAELNQFLHFWALIPGLSLAFAAREGRFARTLPAAWLALALAAGAESVVTLARGSFPTPPDSRPLVAALEAESVTRVYTEHRPAYLIAFLSDERIIASPRADFSWPRDRYPAYTRSVDAASDPTWVFEPGSPNAAELERRCREAAGSYRRRDLAGYVIYDRLTCPRDGIFEAQQQR